MNYQVTKDFPPLNALSSAWKFLELSWLRVLFLVLAWFGIGFCLFLNGGLMSIITSTHDFFLEVFVTIAGNVLSFSFFGFVIWLLFKHGLQDDPVITNPLYSEHESNIYHNKN